MRCAAAVNVGLRQQGRERPRNLLDADADGNSILQAIDRARTSEFRESLSGMVNPHGEGRASETIVRVLTTVPLSQTLLMKRHSELGPIIQAKRLTLDRVVVYWTLFHS